MLGVSWEADGVPCKIKTLFVMVGLIRIISFISMKKKEERNGNEITFEINEITMKIAFETNIKVFV